MLKGIPQERAVEDPLMLVVLKKTLEDHVAGKSLLILCYSLVAITVSPQALFASSEERYNFVQFTCCSKRLYPKRQISLMPQTNSTLLCKHPRPNYPY